MQLSFEQAIRVRLTQAGVQQFEDFFGALNDRDQIPRSRLPKLPPPDKDGWYEMELWMLISVFGGAAIRHPDHAAEYFEGNVLEV